MIHLVYADPKAKVLEKILSGRKTMILRAAAGRRTPYGKVLPGETLYLTEHLGSGKVKACAQVSQVIESGKLEEEACAAFLAPYEEQLALSDAQREKMGQKRFMVLIGIADAHRIEPFSVELPGCKDDWVILEDLDAVRADYSL